MGYNSQSNINNISNDDFGGDGGSLTSPLILFRNPLSNLEATPKQYIDNAINNIPSSKITTGVLDVARFPGFTGSDLSSEIGSGVINLSNTGITAGSYSKVTVSVKGRITGSSNLTANDIPSFSWSKITSNKPTTLAGYGISEGLSKNGDILTGYLNVNEPVNNLHVASKNYTDAQLNNIELPTGDIVSKATSLTPTGFLRCNGGEVNKTTYSALYAVVGDAYIYNTQPGSGQPWRKQYNINTQQSSDITGWTTGTSLPGNFSMSQALVTKNRVYLFSGWNGSSYAATVYTAPINGDGTLGTWTTGTALPGALTQSNLIVTKNRVYLLGGRDPNGYTNTIYTAPINTDGTIGAWTTSASLPRQLSHSQAIVTKNRVYLLGGTDGTFVNTVYTAPINSDGTLGAWSAGTSLPTALGYSQAIVTKSRVYLLGGHIGTAYTANIYTAVINSDGTLGAWTIGSSLPGNLFLSQAIVTKNRVYLLGGFTGGSYVATVYTAPINSDGTLGTWTTGTSLPAALAYSQAIATKNRIYLLGGFNGSAYISTVYTAPILGGLNDYSSYYDGSILATDPNNFRLPDFTSQEKNSLYFYIKN